MLLYSEWSKNFSLIFFQWSKIFASYLFEAKFLFLFLLKQNFFLSFLMKQNFCLNFFFKWCWTFASPIEWSKFCSAFLGLNKSFLFLKMLKLQQFYFNKLLAFKRNKSTYSNIFFIIIFNVQKTDNKSILSRFKILSCICFCKFYFYYKIRNIFIKNY